MYKYHISNALIQDKYWVAIEMSIFVISWLNLLSSLFATKFHDNKQKEFSITPKKYCPFFFYLAEAQCTIYARILNKSISTSDSNGFIKIDIL